MPISTAIYSKKKGFYESKRGSRHLSARRSFFSFIKERFRVKFLLDNCNKGFVPIPTNIPL